MDSLSIMKMNKYGNSVKFRPELSTPRQFLVYFNPFTWFVNFSQNKYLCV